MPCDSTIRTNLSNPEHLEAALAALGYEITSRGETITAVRNGKTITFSKGYGGTYSVARGTQGLTEITVEYAKQGVRKWAKAKGYAVQSYDEKNSEFVFVNRRV